MRISDELYEELKVRAKRLRESAESLDEDALQHLKEVDNLTESSKRYRDRAAEIEELLAQIEGGPAAPEVPRSPVPFVPVDQRVEISPVNGREIREALIRSSRVNGFRPEDRGGRVNR